MRPGLSKARHKDSRVDRREGREAKMDGGKDAGRRTATEVTTRVLVVDDAPVNLLHISHLLQKLVGCDVQTFADPIQALAWSGQNDCDLLIVDYMMPGIDGIEFATRFRASDSKAGVPVLMVTANHDTALRHRALGLGAIA